MNKAAPTKQNRLSESISALDSLVEKFQRLITQLSDFQEMGQNPWDREKLEIGRIRLKK